MSRTTTAPADIAPSTSTSRVVSRLEALLDELASRKNIPHAVMSVESMDGSFRWSGARGAAHPDGTPMREDTPFFVASIDKMFTAVVVLQLHERGALDLEAPIATYLPASLVNGLHRADGQDRTNEITVLHLLGHTSGLASYLEDSPKGGTSLVEALFRGEDREMPIEEIARIVREELRPHFPPQPLEAERPRIRYSDTNFALLHAIVRAVTGRPVPETFRSLVFQPLGLRNTWMADEGPDAGGTAVPATLWAHDRPFPVPAALRSQYPIYSTIHDQTRFMRSLAKAEPFDDAATYDLMRSRWKRLGFPTDKAAARAPSWPIEYGLGIMRLQLPRLLTGFRQVPAIIGHSGSTGTWTFHCPKLDLVLSGAVDQATAGALPYRFLPRVLTALS